MFEISSDKNKIKLSNEGLDDVHLDFKYNFINRIAIKARLPSLDEYKVNSKDLMQEKIKKSIKERSKDLIFGKWMSVLLSGIINILDSVGKVIPDLGATPEIKNFLELGKNIGDNFRKVKSKDESVVPHKRKIISTLKEWLIKFKTRVKGK